jgi:hypothetical protein
MTFNLRILLLVTLLIGCENKSEKYYKSSLKHYGDSNYVRSLSLIDSSLNFEPKNNTFRFQKAKVLNSMGETDNSIAILKSISPLNDSSAYLLSINFYTLYSDSDDRTKSLLDSASKYIDSALILNGTQQDYYSLRIRINHNQEDYTSVIKNSLNALRLFPSDSLKFFLYLGGANYGMKNYSRAIEYLDKITQHNGKVNNNLLADAFRFRALSLSEKEEWALALEDINKAIWIDNQNVYFYVSRALIYEGLNQKDNACLDYRHCNELGYKLESEIERTCH